MEEKSSHYKASHCTWPTLVWLSAAICNATEVQGFFNPSKKHYEEQAPHPIRRAVNRVLDRGGETGAAAQATLQGGSGCAPSTLTPPGVTAGGYRGPVLQLPGCPGLRAPTHSAPGPTAAPTAFTPKHTLPSPHASSRSPSSPHPADTERGLPPREHPANPPDRHGSRAQPLSQCRPRRGLPPPGEAGVEPHAVRAPGGSAAGPGSPPRGPRPRSPAAAAGGAVPWAPPPAALGSSPPSLRAYTVSP
ncbi:basic proline-rich protein-like [Neopsephotus bourkii]|uniref:basic proline-rich protein-like n=1 Tax=Neopsephotus bourkii TaxID=309878 RepID=UPI002AA56054|nr:basic proline-rich protein-like [Neopsephotus bourkii]